MIIPNIFIDSKGRQMVYTKSDMYYLLNEVGDEFEEAYDEVSDNRTYIENLQHKLNEETE